MNEYTIYNPETGQIVKSIRCPSEMLEINLSGTEKYIDGFYNPSTFLIRNGEAVEIVENNSENERINLTRRHSELKGSDWTQLPDGALSDSEKSNYATYRQALRDITTHSNWPNLNDSDWPTLET